MRLGKIRISGLQEWMDSWYDPTPWPQLFGDMAQQRRREHEAWMAALDARLRSGDLMSEPGSQQTCAESSALADPEQLIDWVDSQARNIDSQQYPMVVI